MQANTIDEIINQLETIVADAINSNSRAGYFAALYLKVTRRVKEGIAAGEFEDGARMALLDITFASRYITAYTAWLNKQALSASWRVAFEVLDRSSILILQHLLLGMNAHINLDLGIAAVETAKAKNQTLADLHKDFNSINTILAALTYEVINELDRVSPLLSLAGLHSQNDSLFIQFGMTNARDGAWCFAEDLATQPDGGYIPAINQRDSGMAALAKGLIESKGLLRFTIWIIHLFEWKKPSRITEVLDTYKKTYLNVSPQTP